MIWAFVDYENTGSLENVNLLEYERIFVFCGPRNNKIKFGVLPSESFCCIEVIGVRTLGSNNLDFHLAFHLGRLHEVAAQGIEFHIISNDTGFNGLVNHLKKIGRTCKKVATRSEIPSKAHQPQLSDCTSKLVTKLRQLDGRKRPRKKEKLLNWIKAHLNGQSGTLSPDAVYNELIVGKLVQEVGSDIRYVLKG